MAALQSRREEVMRLGAAAQSCMEAWKRKGSRRLTGSIVTAKKDEDESKTSSSSTSSPCIHIHPQCSVIYMREDSDEGYTLSNGKDSFWFDDNVVKGGDDDDDDEVAIRCVDILDVGNRNEKGSSSSSAAAVQVLCLRSSIAGWLVFLSMSSSSSSQDECQKWQCISAAFSAGGGDENEVPPFEEFQALRELTWNGYCQANRACDGTAMANVFHKTSRLTYVDPVSHQVQIVSQEAFCHKVSVRYSEEKVHIPYRHLKDDPRVSEKDELMSGQFATPCVAMVKLKVGHPPMLWTDFLTAAKLNGKWWIVHKSSCSEPFLVDEKKE